MTFVAIEFLHKKLLFKCIAIVRYRWRAIFVPDWDLSSVATALFRSSFLPRGKNRKMNHVHVLLIAALFTSFLFVSTGCSKESTVQSSSSRGLNNSLDPGAKTVHSAAPTEDEMLLWQLINQHRTQYKLPPLPLSKSLTYVAKAHARDLVNYPPKSPCNTHSWSSHGSWSEVCYTRDHAQAKRMWNKPRELTHYQGLGYENVAETEGTQISPETALRLWIGDSPHNDTILNRGIWAKMHWRSLGVGMYEGRACLWLGEEADSDGYWRK